MYSIKKVTMLLGCLALTCSIAFQASATEKFKVITTFTIIADMAKNVAGDAAEVSSITKPSPVQKFMSISLPLAILNVRRRHN